MDKAKLNDANRVTGISPIEEIIEVARAGGMFILVDAENRENEGDLIIPASAVSPETINFMAKYGRGLICLALDSEHAQRLELDYMVRHNQARNQTAFTVSIEAREGISTGISAHDRAHTISVAMQEGCTPNHIVSPGHVFPLVARDGGVLVRAGHTEAAVDIARLAGLPAGGVICEIMNDDGSMARLPDLIEFASQHELKIGTIEDLIAYRRTHDRFIYQTSEHKVKNPYGGDLTCRVYQSRFDEIEHLALIKGQITAGVPTLVRMHSCNLVTDILGLEAEQTGTELIQKAMRIISKAESGVIVLIRHGEAGTLASRLTPKTGNEGKEAEQALKKENRLLEFGIGAQILSDIGVGKITLLSNSRLPTIIGLDKFNLEIVGQLPITGDQENEQE